MTLEVVVKYVHFICIFGIVGALVGEHLLIQPKMTRAEIKRMSMVDAVYGICAVLLLVAGFTLWFAVGKPAEFYTNNWIFHTKIGLFVIVGLLSIVPTIFFNKNRKGNLDEIIEVPKRIVMFIRIQLLLIFIMPLLATLMARGIGAF
jgi:putative membrane protein